MANSLKRNNVDRDTGILSEQWSSLEDDDSIPVNIEWGQLFAFIVQINTIRQTIITCNRMCTSLDIMNEISLCAKTTTEIEAKEQAGKDNLKAEVSHNNNNNVDFEQKLATYLRWKHQQRSGRQQILSEIFVTSFERKTLGEYLFFYYDCLNYFSQPFPCFLIWH